MKKSVEQIRAKYAHVYKGDGIIYVEAKDNKYKVNCWHGESLEDVLIQILECGTLEIQANQILWNNHRVDLVLFIPVGHVSPEKAKQDGWIFDESDVRSTLFGKRVMRNRIYEIETRQDYRVVTNCRWHLKSSNGEVLSSDELA
jgi:hypothetical protein